MRRAFWASLVVVGVLTAAASAGENEPRPKATPSTPNGTAKGDEGALWKVNVEGTWKIKREEAIQDALAKALEEEVIPYLRRNSVGWTPTPEYVRKNLVKDWKENDPGFEKVEGATSQRLALEGGGKGVYVLEQEMVVQIKDFEPGATRRVRLKVAVTAKDLEDLKGLDRQWRAEHRQFLLVKVLAGVVAVLAAVAGYFRLDEATKGYYTNWLRLAAVGLVGGVGGALYYLR